MRRSAKNKSVSYLFKMSYVFNDPNYSSSRTAS